MAYTEFYCDASSGSNVNAGDMASNGIVQSTNGAWDGTSVFTAAGGTPFSGVSVGDFCAMMLDGGSDATYVSRVTNVGAGGATLTLDTTAYSGTVPFMGPSGYTATTGGAWLGPSGADPFPFGFVSGAMQNISGNGVRVNFKNSATYNIAAGMTHAITGFVRWEGYTSSPGDGGRATFDGGNSIFGPTYTLLTIGGAFDGHYLKNLIFANNGGSGSAHALILTCGSGTNAASGVVVHDVRSAGFYSQQWTLTECEAYNCCQDNSNGAFQDIGGTIYVRCIAHDNNAGGNVSGFYTTDTGTYINCISESNGREGWNIATITNGLILQGCDAYNNASNGLFVAVNSGYGYGCNIENCNFLKNGAYGIQFSSATANLTGAIRNCGFGSGSQANTSGQLLSAGVIDQVGNITYASGVTPWVDPANGDFRINLAAAKGAGRGTFTETAPGYSGTIGYPDIGAAQHQEIASASMFRYPDMSGGMVG